MNAIIDITKFAVIDEIALQKTRYLRKCYSFSQVNGEKEDVSCTYLRRLVCERNEEVPERISQVFSDLGRVHLTGQNDVQTIGSTRAHISQLIWARMCVAAYYYFHEEVVWQKLLFRKMEERIQVPELAADVQSAKALIDEHYRERALLSGTAPTISAEPEIAAPVSAGKPRPNPKEVFHSRYNDTDDYHHLKTFLEQEKAECSDAEWARYALTIYNHRKVLIDPPATFRKWLTIFCDMFGRQVKYQDPNKLNRTKSKKSIESFLL